ncbi:MAG: ATP-dependent protease [Rhodobacteraceae bacterium]|uniref:Lon protease family protein n=1 Tax=Cypionkella sp. TaxID=2811411 RepID=UPI001323AC87|nr:ATP-binding protein [Cypionkella sp.]KAF0172633.1 MAG: ATP-dependent protease [Paracoccaceae bacterium]MDO8325963.1 ATP-binding protein [Cypionkella sp.]
MTETVLDASALRKTCDPELFAFESTKSLELLDELIGQDRAVKAIRLAASIRHRRFNLFVHGPEGSGRHSTVMKILSDEAKTRPAASDWVYVHNFEQPDHPTAICLPVGTAPRLRAALAGMIDDLANHIPALFVSEDYQNRRMSINQHYSDRNEAAFEALREAARARDVGIMRTPMGFSLAPMREGEVLKADTIERLDKAEQALIEKHVKATQEELEDFLVALPELEREHQAAVAKLNAQMAEVAVDAALAAAIAPFNAIANLAGYFTALRVDLIANADLFLMAGKSDGDSAFPAAKMKVRDDPRFHRYGVNVMVSQPEGSTQGAPVVVETLPTLANLTGRIDYMPTQGALVTDLMLIKPGALHRANGGFLVLDARRVLLEPFAWDALKRCLETSAVHIITAADRIGLISTTTLEPEPIPLDVRVVLVGDRLLHGLLSEIDPDFDQFFHVAAEFGDDTERSPEALTLLARLVATICSREGLRPVSRDGVAALIDAATRAAEDQEKLSLRMSAVWDILREADHLAAQAAADLVTAAHVGAAIQAAEDRGSRPRDQVQEMMTRGRILISTKGSVVGQINGLTVADFGSNRFGFPARITARVRMGSGHVIDIEREVKLGGPIHSKAVLILSSFLVTRYAPDTPLSLWASLVFEQSYGGVEGDSASVAELCALMSALAEVPLSQSFAVTGSINQMGEVQPVGGINEKIEGFFDTCRNQGLTGRQGVLIPRRNLANLMLRRDVVAAVAAGQFQIHAISHVDEAMELLTGLAAGQRGMHGDFEDGSINGNIEVKLLTYAEMKRDFNAASDNSDTGDNA